MQLDIDRLVAYFGGVNALAEALKQHDPENAATTAAIYKWRTRGSLPLAQLQKLTALAEAQVQKNLLKKDRMIFMTPLMANGPKRPLSPMTSLSPVASQICQMRLKS